LYCFLDGHTPLNARRLKDDIEKPREKRKPFEVRTPSVGGVKYHPSGGAAFATDSERIADLLSGVLSVEDMDDEELARGYPKNRNGTFAGRPPKVIPHAVHQRIQREFYKRMEEKMKVALPDALQALADIATQPNREDRDKLKAIDMILNRIMGKPLEKIEISSGEKPFEVTTGRMRRSKPQAPASPEPEEADADDESGVQR
jgi:hypothetical protein